MEEKEAFVENSKVAIKGVANGLIGSTLYQIILTLLFSIVITFFVSSQNPQATADEINNLVNNYFNSSFNILITCLASIITLVLFVFIIGFKKCISVFKNFFTFKTLKYGILCAVAIMAFSIVYNSIIISSFNLEGAGNSNQEGVIELIKSNVFFGFVSVVLLAPVVEELTYRYCLFGIMAKNKKWIAYAVSGLLFGLMHCVSSVMEYGLSRELLMDMLYLPPYVFSGLALCYVYDKSNILGSSVCAHFLNNLISFLGIICL